MSSILRALKKLENEPRHLEKSRSLENKFVPLADIAPPRSLSSIFMMVAGAGIVCGLVILAGWWLFAEKGPPPPAVTQEIPLPGSRLGENPAPPPDLNRAQTEAVAEQPEKPSMEARNTPETAERVTEKELGNIEKPVFQPLSPAQEWIQEEADMVEKAASLETNEQANPVAEKPVVPAFSTPAPPAKTANVEIPRLNDPDMNLQAVTWSRTPQKRIAVINNRILREGDMVSGYLISTINQDDVVLSQDGTKWKLLFH